MKKLVFVIGILIGVSAVGQNVHKLDKTHKAAGDKPLFSKNYDNYINNDSSLYSKTVYTYNANKQTTKEVTTICGTTSVDSTVTSYDLDNRVTSINSYNNGSLLSSQIWVYDTASKRIDNYTCTAMGSVGNLDTVAHTIFMGVHDFDGEENSSLDLGISIRDCDSVIINYPNPQTSAWEVFMKAFPVYSSGKLSSAHIEIVNADFLLDMIAGMLPISISLSDASMNMTATYTGDKLTRISVSMSLEAMGFPVTLSNFMVMTNKYSGNLLTETKTEIKVALMIPPVNEYLSGSLQKYGYDSDGNMAYSTTESSSDGTTWDLDSKVYYFYEATEDIAVIKINTPSGPRDNIGSSINLNVTLENNSLINPSQNVVVTVVLQNSKGEGFYAVSETTPPIDAFNVLRYGFTDPYQVPNDSLYSITVYIHAQDNNQNNDTLKVIRKTNFNPVGINKVQDLAINMSQNIPNPANDAALIYYTIPTNGKVTFSVYNMSGQTVFTQSEEAKSGKNMLKLQTKDLASGLYFYVMEFNGQRIVKKMSVEK